MPTWMLARKKPVYVQYREVAGDSEAIHTKEGTLLAYHWRDFIILGVEGEIYPIDKRIFIKTYDVVNRDGVKV